MAACWCRVNVRFENFDEYGGRAARAASSARPANASGESVIGRVVLIPHERVPPDKRISTQPPDGRLLAGDGQAFAVGDEKKNLLEEVKLRAFVHPGEFS